MGTWGEVEGNPKVTELFPQLLTTTAQLYNCTTAQLHNCKTEPKGPLPLPLPLAAPNQTLHTDPMTASAGIVYQEHSRWIRKQLLQTKSRNMLIMNFLKLVKLRQSCLLSEPHKCPWLLPITPPLADPGLHPPLSTDKLHDSSALQSSPNPDRGKPSS